MFFKDLILGFLRYKLYKPRYYRGISYAGMGKRGNRKRQDLKMSFFTSSIASEIDFILPFPPSILCVVLISTNFLYAWSLGLCFPALERE